MPMAFCNKSRRQFLVGTGKTLLALPLLPSLLPSEARAQAAAPNKRMMLFWFEHNNFQPLWPQRTIATTPVGTDGALEVLLRNAGTASTLSPVFRHPLYQSLINTDQLTMIRGLTQTAGVTHGNFALAAGAGGNGEPAVGSLSTGHPTIDSIIEGSPTVYPILSTAANVTRSIRIDMLAGPPKFFQRVGSTLTQASEFPYYDGAGATNSVQTCYNQVFSGLTNGTVSQVDTTGPLKTNILNRVFDSYTQFKNSRKISSDDKIRLDQHMSFISQLQISYSNLLPPNQCVKPTTPTSVSDQAAAVTLYMQLLAMAFQCGLTKYGTMFFEVQTANYLPGIAALTAGTGLGFHGIIHGGSTPQQQALKQQAHMIYWPYIADRIAQDFLTPLNQEEGSTGRTYVQNMITGMVAGGGMEYYTDTGTGHATNDTQQILIGDMNGALRSGRYYNFPTNPYDANSDMPYNCFLITLMQLMGVPPSEYAFTASGGQGIGNYIGYNSNNRFASRFFKPITEVLS